MSYNVLDDFIFLGNPLHCNVNNLFLTAEPGIFDIEGHILSVFVCKQVFHQFFA